ncbi:DUF4363 family protein [Ruminiclostridium herbifermentans]|uniref:DUF4363 family protein n=1 Tax=Ruminiclostridium herbifermentans TaxID=2488810 RepID=A0A4U7JJJ9_9FIRM|nr:DUF4363 family protein [Ruminiclostridium herbifermentans]QNU68352.1 DUF4363 family protein [Ruminiclostridium herbifermentans]
MNKTVYYNVKVIIIIVCLLLSVILSGVFLQYYLECSSIKLDTSLNDTYNSVTKEKWDSAKKQLADFEVSWKKTRYFWAMLLDHYEIDNIDNSFIKTMEYIKSEDFSSAVAELKALRQYVLHIPKRERFSLENIL